MVGGPSEGSLNLYITYVPFGGHENERCKEGRSRRMAWHQMTRLSLRPPSDTEWGEDGERPDGRGKPPPPERREYYHGRPGSGPEIELLKVCHIWIIFILQPCLNEVMD